MRRALALALTASLGTGAASVPAASPAELPPAAAGGLAFEDVTESSGLAALLRGWQVAHAAAWGDADGDGRPDLYVGAFADRPLYASERAPIPNQLFLNRNGRFELSPETSVRLAGCRARTTSAIFADLDNDGDLDLLAANNGDTTNKYQSVLFENDGLGRFRDVTPPGAPWPRPLAVRNVAAADLDRDGLLDLVFTDGNYAHWHTGGGRLIALRHKGGWAFEDVSDAIGFPATGAVGMGLAVGDANDDGVPDFFVGDSCRLFVSGPGGRYREAQRGRFAQPRPGKENHACGAAFGDLNGDGRLDLVTTEHGQPSQIHVYLNQGIEDGEPRYAETSGEAGLGEPLPAKGLTGQAIKTAHLALQDADNDGRVDILLAVTWRDERDRLQPVVLRNLGNAGAGPRFSPPPSARLVAYYAPGPVADFDRDGRLDLFLPTWDGAAPSVLFRNATPAGRWLVVRVEGRGPGLNRMGLGATVRVYEAGGAGDPKRLLGRRDVSVGSGYSSGEEALAHFGLGAATRCDVVVAWGGHTVTRPGVEAGQFLVLAVPAPADGGGSVPQGMP